MYSADDGNIFYLASNLLPSKSWTFSAIRPLLTLVVYAKDENVADAGRLCVDSRHGVI